MNAPSNIYDLTHARLANKAPVKPELPLMGMQLSSLPGFPCLAFYDAVADVSFNVSPSGLLATDPESPTSIAFPAMMLGPTGKLTGLDVKSYVMACMNKFNLHSLADSEGNGELAIHVEPLETLDAGEVDMIHMRIYFTLSPDAYERAANMILKQALAIKLLAEYAAGAGSQTPTQSH
jgi:hypothetical protein